MFWIMNKHIENYCVPVNNRIVSDNHNIVWYSSLAMVCKKWVIFILSNSKCPFGHIKISILIYISVGWNFKMISYFFLHFFTSIYLLFSKEINFEFKSLVMDGDWFIGQNISVLPHFDRDLIFFRVVYNCYQKVNPCL